MSNYNNTYWQKLAGGNMWLPYCPHCHKYIFYPRGRCPNCWGTDLEWQEVNGTGRVYSYTVVHVNGLPEFEEQIPYIYAIIELKEGVRLASNIINCSLEDIWVDMPVEMVVAEKEGGKLPVFKPLL